MDLNTTVLFLVKVDPVLLEAGSRCVRLPGFGALSVAYYKADELFNTSIS